MIETLFEDGIKRGEISEADLFNINYALISGTDPKQYTNRALAFLDRGLPAIQDPIVELDPDVVFSTAVDRNGWMPAHQKKYAKPQGPVRSGTTRIRATGGFLTT